MEEYPFNENGQVPEPEFNYSHGYPQFDLDYISTSINNGRFNLRRYFPWYNEASDYNTNAPSYYDFLGRWNVYLHYLNNGFNMLLRRQIDVVNTNTVNLSRANNWYNADPKGLNTVNDTEVLSADVRLSKNTSPSYNAIQALQDGLYTPDYSSDINDLRKLLQDLTDSGAWNPNTHSLNPGHHLATGNINWFAGDFGSSQFIATHPTTQNIDGDGAFAIGTSGGSSPDGTTPTIDSTSQINSQSLSNSSSTSALITSISVSTSASISTSISSSSSSNSTSNAGLNNSSEFESEAAKIYSLHYSLSDQRVFNKAYHSLNYKVSGYNDENTSKAIASDDSYFSSANSIDAKNFSHQLNSVASKYSATLSPAQYQSTSTTISTSNSTWEKEHSHFRNGFQSVAEDSTNLFMSVSTALSNYISTSAASSEIMGDSQWSAIYAGYASRENSISTSMSDKGVLW